MSDEQKNEIENEATETIENEAKESHKHQAPQIPGKSPKGPNFPNSNQFGKGSNFFNNSYNKQRQGRAAGRGR